jgi:hypothetical protein
MLEARIGKVNSKNLMEPETRVAEPGLQTEAAANLLPPEKEKNPHTALSREETEESPHPNPLPRGEGKTAQAAARHAAVPPAAALTDGQPYGSRSRAALKDPSM